jgi:hypothetical protein
MQAFDQSMTYTSRFGAIVMTMPNVANVEERLLGWNRPRHSADTQGPL